MVNKIEPQGWADLLEKASNSQKPEMDRSKRQYIAEQGEKYLLISASSQKNAFKLPLKKIVEISEQKLEQLKDNAAKGTINKKTYQILANNIKNYTQQLVDQRQIKRHRSKWRVLRRIVKVVSSVFSFFIVRIPLVRKLIKKGRAFLKSDIRQPIRPGLDHLKKIQKKKADIQQQVLKLIQSLPSLIEEVKESFSDQERLELLTQRMCEDYPKDPNALIVPQFSLDMQRNVSFKRKDASLEIDDAFPQPSVNIDAKTYDLNMEQRDEKGAALLKELVKNEEEAKAQHWEFALQLVANQSSLNLLFDLVILKFTLKAANYQWTDPESQKNYALKLDFPKHLPPIELEVIRNGSTEPIEKVNVIVTDFLDVYKYSTGGEGLELVLSKAIECCLTYSVSLDEAHRPVIGDVHTELKSAPPSALSQANVYNLIPNA